MVFYQGIYCDDTIRKQLHKTKIRLKLFLHMWNVYVIVINPRDERLEFFDSTELKKQPYRKVNWVVVGIAKGKEQATTMTASILTEIQSTMGVIDVVGFFGQDRRVRNVLQKRV